MKDSRAVLPISIEELKALDVDTTDIPENVTYAAIFASPYDLKRGLKRWVRAGGSDPFEYSTSYSYLYDECVKFKSDYERAAEELGSLSVQTQQLKDKLSEMERQYKEAVSNKAELHDQTRLNEYKIQSLTEQVRVAKENLEAGKDEFLERLDKMRASFESERDKALERLDSTKQEWMKTESNLDDMRDRLGESQLKQSEQQKQIQLLEAQYSDLTDTKERVEADAEMLRYRLSGTLRSRLITWLFRL